jgi:hypothetical protein
MRGSMPTAYCLLPIAYCLLPTATAYCLLPTAYCYCLLPTAYCLLLLPTAYCLLPTAYCLLPTAIAYCMLTYPRGTMWRRPGRARAPSRHHDTVALPPYYILMNDEAYVSLYNSCARKGVTAIKELSRSIATDTGTTTD